MALSPKIVEALIAEQADLNRHKREIEERLNAVAVLLRTGMPRPEHVREEPRNKVAHHKPRTRRARNAAGLREPIREVLAKGARGPGDVIRELRSAGVSVVGKTPLNVRVYNELKRMREEGMLARDAEGRYALTA